MRPEPVRTAAIIGLIIFLVAVIVAGRPRHAPHPLDISHNGVHAPYNVKNRKGELMLYNFRAVEPKVLYRGSGFPRDKVVKAGNKTSMAPAAYGDGQAFDFLRKNGIRHIVALREEDDEFRAEQGYFEYWNDYWLKRQHPEYAIIVTALPVRSGHAYDLDAHKLKDFPPNRPPFGLRAAAEFIEIMKTHKPQDGAVYIHDNAGKDSTGIVAAAYELWHNQGHLDRETLWQQVEARYLVSNAVIARNPTAARFAGRKLACQGEAASNWVCKRWLEKLRPQLETIAQL